MDKSLAAKIAAASLEVGGALGVDKRNQEQKYDYVSADKIISITGQALAKQGITIYPNLESCNVETITYTKIWQGKTEEKTRFVANAKWQMIIDDGVSTSKVMWAGYGVDYASEDKAFYKAITSGQKYFLKSLLNIGAGSEDGEHEAQSETTEQKSTVEVSPELETARRRFHAVGKELHGKNWDAKRHEIIEKATEGKATSTNDLNVEWLEYLSTMLQKKLNAQLDASAS